MRGKYESNHTKLFTKVKLTSICCTVRSRKVNSERTGMMDFGP